MTSLYPSVSGIYRIVCSTTGKFYIGSAINLHRRWIEHQSKLRCNEHPNKKLQRAWNKYGVKAFSFEILEYIADPSILTDREQYWFEVFDPFGKNGYNIAPIAGSRLGMKHTPETCQKMSKAQIGNKKNYGKKASPEAREKMSKAKLGNQSWIGKSHREESIQKISLAKMGRKPEPKEYEHRMKDFIAISPEGSEYRVRGIKAFCREQHLDNAAFVRVLKGVQMQHKGWKARYYTPDEQVS